MLMHSKYYVKFSLSITNSLIVKILEKITVNTQ